jgi:hypothetical protein
MTSDTSPQPISPLRARMIEDMSVRGFKEDTRRDYVRHVRAFAAFIGRSPDTATAEELRLFQLHQTQSGRQPPSINSAVSALRFFFTVTLDRPDLARRLTVVPYPRRIPTVLSVEEVLLLQAASAPTYKAAFATAEPAPAQERVKDSEFGELGGMRHVAAMRYQPERVRESGGKRPGPLWLCYADETCAAVRSRWPTIRLLARACQSATAWVLIRPVTVNRSRPRCL